MQTAEKKILSLNAKAVTYSQQRGFNLIEILVVLVIMGLLISIVAPNLIGEADKARTQKVFADFRAIETALKIYRLDNYNYPTTEQGLEALVEKPNLDPVPKKWKPDGYLEDLPVDPWGNAYKYQSPGDNGKVDIYTLGADNSPEGEEQNMDLGNWMNPEELMEE
ncbi:MAG: type II secretion system major pseudopilin GspG [Cellvibrionaceae bacterium]